MTPEALKIREYILNSSLSEHAKNEILPLLGVIDTPGIKERILKILEIEGKTADLEEKFLNLDIDNPQGNAQQPVASVAMPVQNPVSTPMPTNVPIQPVAQVAVPNPVTAPVAPQVNNDSQAINQLEDQLKQLQQK